MPRHVMAALSAAIVVLAVGSLSRGEAIVEETVVGPATSQGTSYTLSPRGMRLATVAMKGSRWVVAIDGQEGPKFDEIFNAAFEIEPERWEIGMLLPARIKWEGPVAFSPDGSRFAYAAREGEHAVVIVDGKEIWRGPSSQKSKLARLAFTPDSKHVYFYHQAEQKGVIVSNNAIDQAMGTDVANYSAGHIVFDGQPGPLIAGVPRLFFSPDGSRWGYLGHKETGYNQAQAFLVVDGKEVGYAGGSAQFTPDGKHVVCLRHDTQTNQTELLVDGKPILRTARIHNFTISAGGDIAAIADDAKNPSMLYINGKPVAGTEHALGGPSSVGPTPCFSPDGKQWAVLCGSGPRAWAVVDGKKQQEYNGVREVKFSPDSSRCLYIAEMSNMKFVVVNGEEEDGNVHISVLPFFAGDNHYAYVAGQPGGFKAYYDGKPLPQSSQVTQFTLSPDGKRYAFYAVANALSSALVVDGEVKGAAGGFGGGSILFSPDSKHVVASAQSPTDRNANIYIDGEYIAAPAGVQYPQFLGFTPDSKHLIMSGTEGVEGRPARCFYVDGQRVAAMSAMNVTWGTAQPPKFWDAQEDGTLVVVGPEPGAMQPGPMRRTRITPDPNTSVATLAEQYAASIAKKADEQKAAKERAEADKKAAMEKAAADRQAALEAREKLIADQKAAREKALAERQAAYEKAVAEKKAAAEKAAADRKAALEKAAAEKAAKRRK